jgi:serine/threonine protein kinase
MSQVRFAEIHEEFPNDDSKGSSRGRTRSPAPEHRSNANPSIPAAGAASATPAAPPSSSAMAPSSATPTCTSAAPRGRPTHYKRSSSSSFHSKVIRENLMREVKDRDPLFYYEVASVLGVGSMGSVAKVRKRDSVVGGSARKGLQKHFEKERKLKVCFSLPFVGGMFRACLDPPDDNSRSDSNHDGDSSTFVSNVVSSSTATPSRNSSILNTKNARFEVLGGGGGGGGSSSSPPRTPPSLSIDGQSVASGSTYEQYYAMKSIHLSRVTDPSFVEELKNEIQILRSLDHPRE